MTPKHNTDEEIRKPKRYRSEEELQEALLHSAAAAGADPDQPVKSEDE